MALNDSIHRRLWSKAARHPDGDGLQGGMGLHSASLAYRSTRKRLGAPFASTAATFTKSVTLCELHCCKYASSFQCQGFSVVYKA